MECERQWCGYLQLLIYIVVVSYAVMSHERLLYMRWIINFGYNNKQRTIVSLIHLLDGFVCTLLDDSFTYQWRLNLSSVVVSLLTLCQSNGTWLEACKNWCLFRCRAACKKQLKDMRFTCLVCCLTQWYFLRVLELDQETLILLSLSLFVWLLSVVSIRKKCKFIQNSRISSSFD